jgi:hypothetical protein
MWVTIEIVPAFKPSMTPVGLLIVVWGPCDPLAEFGEWGTAGAAVFWLCTGAVRDLRRVVFLLPPPLVCFA